MIESGCGLKCDEWDNFAYEMKQSDNGERIVQCKKWCK